jgi:formamidopyrimidine-DNA glycosylase
MSSPRSRLPKKMPEMPEVETIARKLRRTVVGKEIAGVYLSGLPLRRPVPKSFPAQLRGRTVRRIHRRGKYLIAEMEPRLFWLIHLGMTGRFSYLVPTREVETHTHATIRFSDATELRYRDPRRFGLLAAYEVSRLSQIPELKTLGKDPLGSGFDQDWLWTHLSRSRQEIKSFLLDQRRIAGLGNIYVCEALFHARIHPSRRCFTVTREEAGRLAVAVRKVLLSAIQRRGTSFSDFIDLNGEPGNNQNFLRVFQREGKRCRRCRAPIERLRQGNRSSFLCPGCQVKPRLSP